MKTVHFPRWAEILDGVQLDDKVCKGYRITIRWYLSWCAKQGVGCSVESARNFVEGAVVSSLGCVIIRGRKADAILN